MPLRAPKMNCFILGFQRPVLWPKCTPASSSALIEIGFCAVASCIVSMSSILLAVVATDTVVALRKLPKEPRPQCSDVVCISSNDFEEGADLARVPAARQAPELPR